MRTLLLTCSLLLAGSVLAPTAAADGSVAVCTDVPKAQFGYDWTGPPDVSVGFRVYGEAPWAQGSLNGNPC